MKHVLALFAVFVVTGCGGLAWNTTVADHPQVRQAMLASIQPGLTTEKRFTTQWGNPTQKIYEGGQVSYVYRNMSNPPGYYAPQYGTSGAFVVVNFQYGLAVGAYSSDTQGCRATFAPRPPGNGFDNPSTVHSVSCGVAYDGSSERRPIAEAISWLNQQAQGMKGQMQGAMPKMNAPSKPNVPPDTYVGTLK